MNNECCCHGRRDFPEPRRSWTSTARQAIRWIVPSVILAAMPKCPMCVAAYVTLLTGCGISLAAAISMWWVVVVGCAGSLAYFTMQAVRRVMRKRGCV